MVLRTRRKQTFASLLTPASHLIKSTAERFQKLANSD